MEMMILIIFLKIYSEFISKPKILFITAETTYREICYISLYCGYRGGKVCGLKYKNHVTSPMRN